MAYVYRHIRLDKNQPFYVGIGTDSEGEYRRAFMIKGRNLYWRSIIKNTPYEVEIIMDNISREYALEKEIEFISIYGRKDTTNGILANQTDGGDGGKSVLYSEERRLKISMKSKEVGISKETRTKMGLKRRGLKLPKWHVERIRASKIGVPSKKRKSILQYDHTGQFIMEYLSIRCAAKLLGIVDANIHRVLSGARSNAGGFFFIYKTSYEIQINIEIKKKFIPNMRFNSRAIIDMESGIIYHTVSDAARSLNIRIDNMWNHFKRKKNIRFKYI